VDAQINEHETRDKIAALEADLKELHETFDTMESEMESKIVSLEFDLREAQENVSALEQLDR